MAEAFSCTGGISGRNIANSSISNSYNTSSVTTFVDANTSKSYIGGVSGYNEDNSAVRNSYWNIDSKQTINGNDLGNTEKKGLGYGVGQAAALTSSQMKTQSSFPSWDFNTVWTFTSGKNNGYPVLRGF